MHRDSLIKKSVFITAINSFTGNYMSKNLKSYGFEVFGSVSIKERENTTYFRCDITDRENVREILKKIIPDYIIHLAGITFVPHSNIKQFYETNLFGTLNILDVCIEEGILPHKIIIPSSANVYGNPSKEIVDEGCCPCPLNHYANSKLAMEHMVKTYFNSLKIIITRPFNYTGVGQSDKFVIPKIINHFKEKKPFIELGNIHVVRDFSDVRFVVDIYRKLMISDLHSDIFNICSSKGVSISDIINICSEISGHTLEIKINNDFIRKNEINILIGDNSRLKSAIGEIDPINIRETIFWMLNS